MLEEAAGTSGLNEETAPLPRLSVRRLSKRYGNVQALDDIDFELRPGEVMALLGENGAGKSTLVKILSGLVQPDSGTIEIDGKPASLYPSARSQAAGVAVVHQEYSSVPTLSVAENLVLGQKVFRRFGCLVSSTHAHEGCSEASVSTISIRARRSSD